MSTAKIKITRLREIAALPDDECATSLRLYLGSLTMDERRAAFKRFTKPTEDEVRRYCQERGNGVDAQAFCSYYESKGWLIGKTPMKDWRAAVRTWENREKQRRNENGSNNYFGRARGARDISDIGKIVQDGERLATVFRRADK